MEFRLLGPLEVISGGAAVPLGGAKQQALLAVLLVHANEVVSRDALLEGLWPGRTDAGHSLDIQISRLRKALQPAEPLTTRAGGYVLEVEPEQIDAHRFERLLEQGRQANAAGRPEEAASDLKKALSLWRGAALGDLAYEGLTRVEAERLEELRLVATEERIEAGLALGEHRRLGAELESLMAKHPLRERFRAQLMLALYRSGRQAEALRVYGDGRRRLVEELGLEPGPALQQLEQAILRQDSSLDLVPAAGLVRRHRRPLLAALAVALAAGAAAAGVLLASGGTGESSGAQSRVMPGSLAILAASSGKIVRQVQVQAPARSSFGKGALWTLSAAGTLTKIDPATGRVLASLNTGAVVPCGLAVGEGAVWVTDCTSPLLARVDPAHGVVERIALPRFADPTESSPHEVALGAGSVWVEQGDFSPSWLTRLDPRTGHVQNRIRIEEVGADALAFGDGALWVVSGYKGYLTRIDPRTNRVTATVRSLPGNMCCVAVGGGFVWAATGPDRKVWKLSEDGTVLASITLKASAEDLTYAGGALWVADGEAGTVVRIDATTNAMRSYPLGHHLRGAAVRGGLVAVGVEQNEQDVTAGPTGKIVRVALGSNQLDWSSTDPAATQYAFNPWQVQFQYATCAKLLTYPDASGAAGKRLVPEVAAASPAVSQGGRTYAFRVRPGFRFSPPSNEPVTAESFRHAIERFLSPVLQPGPWNLAVLADVVGASAYHAGLATHVSGVSVRGDTLVIRLLKPAGDLPARLALPSFCAVPAGLPVAYRGLHDPIPSAGPYYLAARAHDVLVLRRNPNYHGPRPHALDAIVYRMNVDVGAAAAQVERGKLDLVFEDDPALAPSSAAARKAGPRYRRIAKNWISVLALNTRRPLFADRRVRRAVEYAVDRSTLAGAAGLATGHLLPPNFQSFSRGPGYPLTADLRTARRLMGGRHLRAVFAAYDPAADPVDAALVRAVRDELAAIGIAVTILPLHGDDDPTTAATLAQADLATVGRDASQTRDPVTYLAGLPYLPEADLARLGRFAGLPSPRREAAAAALAERLEREAVYVPYVDYAIPELVSKRSGCIVHQPVYPGVDLAALCVRPA
jgi:DNA-binding SARP family transcriptional activator/ABC-type transport system substrate-binding protein/streptogramin lyase